MSSGELLLSFFLSLISNILYQLVGFVFIFTSIYIFFSCFFTKRKSSPKPFVYIIYGVWRLILGLGNTPLLINAFALIMIFSLFANSWFEGKFLHKIAFSCILFTLFGLSESMIVYFFTLLGENYQLHSVLGTYLEQLLLLLIVFYLYIFMGIYRIRNLPAQYYITLSLLPLSTIFFTVKILMYSVELEYERAVRDTTICMLVLFAINILIFKLYISLADEMSDRKYNAIYAQQLELYGKTVREREMSMAEYRSIRHDMKQHFSSVLNMLEKQNYQTAEEYLKKLVEDNTDHSQICRTENPVVDAIVNAKYSFMKTLGIECTADIHIPMLLPFEMADMSVLLGNVLDNAIEANNDSVAKKYIKIYMAYDKNILIITVINSYDGILLRDKTGKILTRKDDQNAHGFGLISIEKIVQKYHGSMVTEETSEEFKIKLIMVDDKP